MIGFKEFAKILFIGIIITFLVIASHLIKFKKERNEYKILARADYCNGIVTSKKSYQGVVYVEINNNYKYHIPASLNYDYTPKYADEFVNLGDSITKLKNTDTIFIYRNNKCYFFIIGNLHLNKTY